MNRKTVLIGSIALLMSYNGAWAQESDGEENAEATIRLMGAAEAELPEAVTNEITLPDAVEEDSAAVENAARGLETANANRTRREQELNRADEAREHGAEMSEEAMENRENRGRADDRPDRPDPPQPQGPPGDA